MIGIVGAGASGLALAHHLSAAGVETTVWEASEQAGGVVRTREAEGQPLECGPQRVRLTPGIHELAKAAGVADDVVTAPELPLYGYRDGRPGRMPLSPRAAVATDLLSWRAKARVLLEPLTGRPREGETVASYLRRSFGREAADYCLGPLYAGLYASTPEEMPVEHSLSKALDHAGVERSVLAAALRKLRSDRERPPMASVEGGLQRLAAGLADAHDVRLGTPVEAVERAGDGYAVETPDGRTVVDDLVVTTPAGVAADLLGGVAPDAADRLGRLSYNPLAVVHLRADWPLDGAGLTVPSVEGFATRGLTAHEPLFGREGVVTAYLGGSHAPGVVDRDDGELRDLAVEEYRTLTGAGDGAGAGDAAEVLAVTRLRPGMPAYDRTWDALDGLSLPDGLHLCTNYVARAGLPGRVRQARRLADGLAADQSGRSDAVERPAEAD